MQHMCRILFLVLILIFSAKTSSSQLIEKAPPSPVAVTAPSIDTANALITISDIIITGCKKTKPYIIEREVPFKKGDYLLYSNLQKQLGLCKQQLMNTTL